MELLSGQEKIITKSGISLNAGTLNWGFTVIPCMSAMQYIQYVLRTCCLWLRMGILLSKDYCFLEYNGKYTESHSMLLTPFKHILTFISFKIKYYHILNS
jgi:hypothetical protein